MTPKPPLLPFASSRGIRGHGPPWFAVPRPVPAVQVLAVVLYAGLLVSCSTPPPVTTVAGLPTPAHWVAPISDHAPEMAGWWAGFGSTNLSAAVAEAVAGNHDLELALARLDAATAQARMAGADLYPQVNFAFDAARRQQVFVGLPIPGSGDSPLKSTSTGYQAVFNLGWEIDLWGRVRSGQRAAVAAVQGSAAEYRGALESVAGQAARRWLAAVEARRQLDLAQATAESFGKTASQVRERYQRGLRSALDLRLALNNEAAAKALVSGRQVELGVALRQLEILLGQYPAGRWKVDARLPELPPEIPAGLPSELLQRRPDLVAAERRVAAALQRVKEANAALLPRISLTASGGRSSGELEDLLSSQFNMWSLAANAVQPLFQGGRLRANIDLNEAQAREAVAHYRQVVLRAFGEVETALGAEQDLRQRETELRESVLQSGEAERLARERYLLGLVDFLAWNEAQRNAFSAESQLIAVRRALLENRVNLYLALGGGFDEPTLAAAPLADPTPG